MTALVKEGSEIAEMSAADFRRMVQADPALYLSVLRILAAETRSARIAILNAGSAPCGLPRRGRQRTSWKVGTSIGTSRITIVGEFVQRIVDEANSFQDDD
jgi:CRP-like cAMP-binding protein